ncbi:response regulator [Spirosoma spitsbergense]|uniref:response regulator n=1 Tax=Spirosoma spitsbergense TaxID=431554 RepID=UPI00038183F4|nr:response regulator transcription factor [Spirosoma spitsbergense]
MPISVAIVDDNITLLHSLIRNLEPFGAVTVLFTATNGQQAVEMAQQQPPDVILMDIDMPILDGIRATALLHNLMPETKILMLTIFDRDDKLFDAIKAGASGYLLKDEPPARIVAAVEEALDGGSPMSPGIASRALAMLRRQTFADADKGRKSLPTPESYYLTPREIEILEHLSLGLVTAQIADQLFISDRTVRKHVENIYEKLHVHSKYEAIQLAGKHNWFT